MLLVLLVPDAVVLPWAGSVPRDVGVGLTGSESAVVLLLLLAGGVVVVLVVCSVTLPGEAVDATVSVATAGEVELAAAVGAVVPTCGLPLVIDVVLTRRVVADAVVMSIVAVVVLAAVTVDPVGTGVEGELWPASV